MAHPQGRKPEPVGSGSTNRGFATLDPERQGAPPRQKAPRGPQLRPAPAAPVQRQRVEREEPEDAQAEP